MVSEAVSQQPEAANRRADKLLHKMWRTKSCQFNARVRLERRHWLSVLATSVLSCYLAAGSIYQLAYGDSVLPANARLLTVTNLVVSIFLIMITLYEAARNYLGAAEKMHASALDIAGLYNKLQSLPRDQVEKQRCKFADEYSATLKRHNVIHSDLDYAWFKITNAGDLDLSWPYRLWLLFQIIGLGVVEYWLYATLIVVPPLAFFWFLQ